jgi:copper homeostasis protein
MSIMPRLEIAATTFEDAVHAQQGGADSIEISQDLSVGGLTPSLALVRQIREAVSLKIHVILRPHARSFVYTAADMDQILSDASALARMGIDGMVFGALTSENRLNIDQIRQVQIAAGGLTMTVHRALDESAAPEADLNALRGMVPRILTSGPAADAWAGRDGLKRWVEQFGQDFSFVASGGLRLDDLPRYVPHVRAQEYHFGGAARSGGAVDRIQVQRLRAALDTLTSA